MPATGEVARPGHRRAAARTCSPARATCGCCFDRFHSSDLALAAYNAGPTAVARAGRRAVDRRSALRLQRQPRYGTPSRAAASARRSCSPPAAAAARRTRRATTDATRNGCTTVEQPKPAARKAAKPTTGLDPSKTYTVTCRRTAAASRSTSPSRPRRRRRRRSSASCRRASSTTRSSTASCPASSSRAATRPASGLGGPGYSTVDKPPADGALHARHRRDGEDAGRAGRHERQPVLRRHRAGRTAAARLRDRSARSRTGSTR